MARFHRTGVPTTTIGPLNLFVSGLNGDDDNTGLSAGSPLATLIEAEDRLPDIIDHLVIIHLGNAGASPYAMPLFRERIVRARVWLIGDGAGQSGEPDGFRAVAGTGGAGTADGSSTINELVFGAGGMTPDAFLGKTLEITSGASVEDRRTISENTATTFKPTRAFTASVAGSTYRVIEPDVDIDVVQADPDQRVTSFAIGFGRSGLFQPDPNLTGLFFVNLRFVTTGSTTTFPSWDRSRIGLFGVEVGDFPISLVYQNSFVTAGIEATAGSGVFSARDDFGLPSKRTWDGWGLSRPLAVAASTFLVLLPRATTFRAFLVGQVMFTGAGSSPAVFGGRLYGGGFGPTFKIAGQAIGSLRGPNSTLALRVDGSGSGSPTIELEESANLRLTRNVDVRADAETAIRVRENARLNIQSSGGITVDSTSGFGIDASLGGKVTIDQLPPVTGGAGDLTVDGATPVSSATLAAVGESIGNPDGSVILRSK